MEILVFAVVAARKGYTQQVTLVRESAKFQPFDLRPLRNSYGTEEDSASQTPVSKKWIMA